MNTQSFGGYSYGAASPAVPAAAAATTGKAVIPFAQSDAEVEASMCLTRLKRNILAQTAKVVKLEKAEVEFQQTTRSLVEERNQLMQQLQEKDDKLDVVMTTQTKDREGMEKYRKDIEMESRKEREEGETARSRLKASLDTKSTQNEQLRAQLYALEDMHRDDERQITALRTELEGYRDVTHKSQEQFVILKRVDKEVENRLNDCRNEMAEAKSNHKLIFEQLDKQKEIARAQHERVRELTQALEKAHSQYDELVAQTEERAKAQRAAEAEVAAAKQIVSGLEEALASARGEKRKLLTDFLRTQYVFLGKKDALAELDRVEAEDREMAPVATATARQPQLSGPASNAARK